MNKLALSAATLFALMSQAVHAQSTLTLYGRIDEGLTFVDNEGGGHNTKLDSGVLYPNIWGLAGHEDLGGGNTVVFKLEGLFDLNSGKMLPANTEFAHQALIGLETDYGRITMGYQYDMAFDFFNQFNVSALGSGYAVHQGDFDHTNNDRMPNSVKYTSPTIKGFQFAAMYGFSNTAGNFHNGSAWSVGGQYANGPLTIGADYTFEATPTLDPYAQIGLRTFFGVPTVTGTGNSATDLQPAFTLHSLATFGIGASYAIGDFTLYGNFTDTTLKYQGEASVMHVYEGGATYQANPFLQFVVGYQHTGFQGYKWNQVTAAANYALSKRTQIYISSDYVKASAGVDAVLGEAFAPSSTGQQADVRIGIVHSF
ncbi:porin [Paraburkholderia sp.]|uniref:porin n=1 Tax=Paraburkholderia sp. TaxID=1926495 RepID=UPI002D4FA174|nr:porin [Paraburkholderia sp.]HZZ05617.1 porin [Paraburkholderia sp.]